MRTAAEIVDALAQELLAPGDIIDLDSLERRAGEFEKLACLGSRGTPRRDLGEAIGAHLRRVAGAVRLQAWLS